MSISHIFNAVLGTVYPRQCVCCGHRIADEEEICLPCRHWLERMHPEKRCFSCGLEKQHCQCTSCTYHFEKIVAPFYNAGLSQRGFYRLKFSRRPHYARFFAREMAKTVHTEYYGMNFDAICYVPISRKHLRRRGFNQSMILAKELGKILKIPVLYDAIICRFSGKTQHEQDWNSRFRSIRNKYEVGMEVSGNILLVDDIKTSGATLDECARELLFAGADKVYCVAALISDPKFSVTAEYTKEVCANS